MFQQVLIDNGLSEKEANLYLTVLEAGEITPSRAAQKAHLKRSTVYSLTEVLKQKGIITVTKKKGLTYLSALSPRLLIDRFEKSTNAAKSALPLLIDLAYSSPVKPRIHFHDGIQGIKDILFEAAACKSDYVGFIDYTLMPQEVYDHIQKKVAPQRAKDKTHLKLLMPDNQINKRVAQKYTLAIEHKLINFPSRKNHIEILLYENSKIGFMSYVKDEMFGVVIDSEAIYQTLHDLFMVIWERP